MSAKDLVLRPISSTEANAVVRRHHYSGKVVNNSQLHIGVFYGGKLEGAMQFGPSLDKRKVGGLVRDTPWNGFLELNRMAFSEVLPRNSESRALAIALRLLRQHAPHVQWVVSFADATQSGDGAIYRATGFVLTAIKRNNQIWIFPEMVATDTRRPQRGRLMDAAAGARFSRTSLTDGRSKNQQRMARAFSRGDTTKGSHIQETGGASMKPFIEAGAYPRPGFQLRYVYFIDPTARERLTVPVLPFSEIDRVGARMYRGQSIQAPEALAADAVGVHPTEGGATPTSALQLAGVD